MTAQDLRAQAARHEQDAHDSFERCDTDGFLSQWASDRMAGLRRLEADILDAGGSWTFTALGDLDGNLVPAKVLPTRYGHAWAVFASFDALEERDAPIQAWVALGLKEHTLARKGYRLLTVRAKAKAKLVGDHAVNVHPTILPRDRYFTPDNCTAL